MFQTDTLPFTPRPRTNSLPSVNNCRVVDTSDPPLTKVPAAPLSQLSNLFSGLYGAACDALPKSLVGLYREHALLVQLQEVISSRPCSSPAWRQEGISPSPFPHHYRCSDRTSSPSVLGSFPQVAGLDFASKRKPPLVEGGGGIIYTDTSPAL